MVILQHGVYSMKVHGIVYPKYSIIISLPLTLDLAPSGLKYRNILQRLETEKSSRIARCNFYTSFETLLKLLIPLL